MELAFFLGVIGPIEVIILGIIYFSITITALYLVIRKEKSLAVFVWILAILIFPLLGSIIYLIKYFSNKNRQLT